MKEKQDDLTSEEHVDVVQSDVDEHTNTSVEAATPQKRKKIDLFKGVGRAFSHLRPSKIVDNIRHKRLKPIISYVIILGIIVLGVLPATRYAALGTVVKRPFQIALEDNETKKPITEATVQIDGVSTKTDAKGIASFDKLSVGAKTATITKPNYEEKKEQVFVGLMTPKEQKKVELTATGRQVVVQLRDFATKKPLSDVFLKADTFEARSDEAGQLTLIAPTGVEKVSATVSKDGFSSKDIEIKINESATVVEQNTFDMVPAGRLYFLSKQTGKIDVVSSDLDGSNRKTVLEGTGYELEQSTLLVSSRDWQHIAVLSVRNNKRQESISYIRASDGKVTVADEGDATFKIVGWYGSRLVYIVTRNVENTAEKYKLKSYDTASGKITLLQASAYRDDGYSCSMNNSYCGNKVTNEIIDYATLVEGGVIYAVNTFTSIENSSSVKIYRVSVEGENKKEVGSLSGYVYSLFAWDPVEAYLSGYIDNAQKYYELTFSSTLKEVTDPVDKNKVDNGTYNTYLLSPDGTKSFWSESRDGKNVFFVGGKTGEDPKEVGRLSEFSAYGWFTDKYVLLAKNNSEMFIMSVDGGEPVKITDYHKPNNGYRPYGYGYGG